MLAFECHWNHFISISRASALHKTPTEGQICQSPPFCIFHPKMPSKHKTKNIKAFYTQNICKTLSKYG